MKAVGLKRVLEARRGTLVGLGLALATVAAYWQVRGFGFTNYDDSPMLVDNPTVGSGLTVRGMLWALSTSFYEYWHPLTWLSHMLDYQLFGARPGWHHLMSVGFHVANTVLLFVVLRRMTGALWRSAMVAALFALHPLHVESVAWLAERKDVLSAFFFMLTLWAYARYAEVQSLKSKVQSQESDGGPQHATPVLRSRTAEGGLRRVDSTAEGGRNTQRASRPKTSAFSLHPSSFHFYLLSLCFFALGLMSKPMVVTLPFVLLLLDYWPLGRMRNAECGMRNERSDSSQYASRFLPSTFSLQPLAFLLLEKLPFFALTVASCAITYGWAARSGNIASAAKEPLGLRLANLPVSYVRYVGKTIWPADLTVIYPMPSGWAGWLVGGAALVLVLISWFVVVRARSAPYGVVGWLVFLGMLFPTIPLVQSAPQSIADRYTYLPSIGLFVALVWGGAELAASWRCRRAVLGAAAAAILTGLLVGAYVQTRYWKDSEVLFRHALEVTENNDLAHINLGTALVNKGQTDEAIRQFQEAVHLKPDAADAHYNLGIAFGRKGQTDAAIGQFQEALRLKPDYAYAHYNLGNALLGKGQTDEAIAQYQEALRLKPDYADAHNNLGNALARKGQLDEAVGQYQEALRLKPDYADAHYNLGAALEDRGQADTAIRQYQEAVRLKPDYAPAHNNLGNALAKQGQTEEAIHQYQEALRLKPGYAEANTNLAYLRTGYPKALGTRASTLDGQGKYAEAIRLYRAALKAQPDQEDVLNNLAWLLATCPDAAFRNGREAVRLATRACELTGYAKPLLIGTLAAAQAEAGAFAAAIATAERAAALATDLRLEDVAAKNRELLQLYRQGQAFHEKKGGG